MPCRRPPRADNATFLADVHSVSSALVEVGIGRGDVVAVVLPNSVELVIIMFAAWRLGAAVTPVNPALTEHEVKYQLTDSGARLVVADELSLSKVERAASRVCALSTSCCYRVARLTLGCRGRSQRSWRW